MPTFANLEKPPFYTAIYLTAGEGEDQGLFSEAASTMVSTAMLLSGFVGFADDTAAFGRPVKLVYWRTFHAMRAWRRTVFGCYTSRQITTFCCEPTPLSIH